MKQRRRSRTQNPATKPGDRMRLQSTDRLRCRLPADAGLGTSPELAGEDPGWKPWCLRNPAGSAPAWPVEY